MGRVGDDSALESLQISLLFLFDVTCILLGYSWPMALMSVSPSKISIIVADEEIPTH